MSDTLERPSKRPRLSFTPGSPEELPEQWDLQAARTENNLRLKSVFEGIFAKYGRDFTEVGDEIDLETGRIVVDNGHLLGMREEHDTGDSAAQAWLYEESQPERIDQLDRAQNSKSDELEKQPPRSPSSQREGSEFGSGTEDKATTDSFYHPAQACAGSCSSDTKLLLTPPDPQEDILKDPGPTDPLWQTPELPAIFSTPTSQTRHANMAATPQVPRLTREASPPESGSLWAVPRQRRPRTEGKPRATPSKSRPRAKRKHHSSPVARDWSFAKTPDGDESDDPLQEYQPSPTPLRVRNIRGMRSQPLPQIRSQLGSLQPSPCQQPDSPVQSATEPVEDGETRNHNDLEQHNNITSKTAEDVNMDVQYFPCTRSPIHDIAVLPRVTPITPKKAFTPDEVKLIVYMRYVQGKQWGDIQGALPGRKLSQIHQWNYFHWTDRHKHPPKLSAPWSQNELEKLEVLKDQQGSSWTDIKSALPCRSQAEIEFELIRLWVGRKVWNDEQRSLSLHESFPIERNESVEVLEAAALNTRAISVSEADPTFSVTKPPRRFETFIGENDDPAAAFNEPSSPCRVSTIRLDSPEFSPQGSKTPNSASPAKRFKLAF